MPVQPWAKDGVPIAIDGQPIACETCPCGYRQARECPSPDGTLADVYMLESVASAYTGAFKLDGDEQCYYFDFDDDVIAAADVGTVYTPGDVARTYADCDGCENGCECCDSYTITIGAPYPDSTVYGMYDVVRDPLGGCTANGSTWGTDPPFNEEDPIVGTLRMSVNPANGFERFDIVNSEGGIVAVEAPFDEDATQTATGGYCPETYLYAAGITVVCAD